MSDLLSDYEVVSSIETDGAVGVKILMRVGRTLDKTERRSIRKHAEEILHNHMAVSNKRNEKRQEGIEAENAQLLAMFGNEKIFVEKLPNGYCSEWCCRDRPWFQVTTKIGRIVVGWRKSVIAIDWSGSLGETKAEALFPGEDTTKFERSIHAWSYELGTRYIKTILAAKVPAQ